MREVSKIGRLKRRLPVSPQSGRNGAVDMENVLRRMNGRQDEVQNSVRNGGCKKREREAEMLPRTRQRIAAGQQRKDHVGLHGQEAGQKRRPGPNVVPARGGFDVSQEEMQGQQQEEPAKNQVIRRAPAHDRGELAVRYPENGGPESDRKSTRLNSSHLVISY